MKFTTFKKGGLLAAATLLASTSLLFTAPASAATPAQIKAKGEVVIGIQAANPPWGYVNAATGEADGVDADMGKAFAKYLGVKAKFVGLEVANRIPALTSGRVDVLFATMAMLPDRAKAVQFSEPYIANSITLVAPKTTVIKTDADMKNFVIGVPRSSVQDIDITKAAPKGTTIRRFDDDAATIQAMLSGQVQAVGGNAFYVKRLDDAKPGMFENKLTFTRLYNGACSPLGDKELNTALNDFINQMKSSGELARIQTKWMGYSMMDFPKSIPGIPFVAK